MIFVPSGIFLVVLVVPCLVMRYSPLYSILLQDLFDQLSDTDGCNAADMNPKELCPLLLFGDENLRTVVTESLGATIFFIKALARLT